MPEHQDPGQALLMRQTRLGAIEAAMERESMMAQRDATSVTPRQEEFRPDTIGPAEGRLRPLHRRELASEGPAGVANRALDLLGRVTGLGGEAGGVGLFDPSLGVGKAIGFAASHGMAGGQFPRKFASREQLWDFVHRLPTNELIETHRIADATPVAFMGGATPFKQVPGPQGMAPRLAEHPAMTEGIASTLAVNRELLIRANRGDPAALEYIRRSDVQIAEGGESLRNLIREADRDFRESATLVEMLGLPFILP